MMKIAVIGTRGFPGIQGGVEKHCENIYSRMKGVSISVYRRKPYLHEKSSKTYRHIGYIDLPSTRVKGFEAVFHTFLSVMHILFHRPDVVHVHNIGPGMFIPLLRLFRVPVTLTYHSPNYEHKKWGFLARHVLKGCERISLHGANQIIFVNKFQREKYSQRVLGKSVYIPNGIRNMTRSKETLFLERYGIKAGRYLLSVGRLTPEKGFDYLVQAANAMPEVEQVVIAGTSDHDNLYFQQLRKLDIHKKVVFTGFTHGEDLRELYSYARLFVLASVNEGFPLVLLEAMGYGLPLAVSDIPATHLVKLDQDDYFACADVQSMEKIIAAKLAQPYATVAYDLSAFNWQEVSNRTLEVLEIAAH